MLQLPLLLSHTLSSSSVYQYLSLSLSLSLFIYTYICILSTYLPTYLPTYLSLSLYIYIHTYMYTHIHTYITCTLHEPVMWHTHKPIPMRSMHQQMHQTWQTALLAHTSIHAAVETQAATTRIVQTTSGLAHVCLRFDLRL